MMINDQEEACMQMLSGILGDWAAQQLDFRFTYTADVQRGIAELCCFPGLHERPSPRSIADRCGGEQEESEQEAGAGSPSL